VIRLLWRLSHKAPPHPAGAPIWEKFAAGFSHLAFYALLFALPLSGWVMVSVSSLNIDTLLFNRFEWPHLPILEWLNITDAARQDQLEHQAHKAHHLAGNVLILLLLVHIGAALKHHFIDKDDVLTRMRPRVTEPRFLALLFGLIAAVVGSVFAVNYWDTRQGGGALSASDSSVVLKADVSGSIATIEFSGTEILASIDLENLAGSSLEAVVNTGTVTSDNLQVQGSLPDAEWFDVANHPTATFASSELIAGEELNTVTVTGQLTIKNTTETVTFLLTIEAGGEGESTSARADFPVDRFAFDLGLDSQPNEDYVKAPVIVEVRFQLSPGG